MQAARSRSRLATLAEPAAALALDGDGPLYEQIKRAIAGKVMAGLWRPGDRIPTELDLVERCGVSRMTVNRALRDLEAEGLIVRLRSAGTFVAPPKPESAILEIRDIKREIEARGEVHSADVLHLGRAKAGAEGPLSLGLPAGAPLYHLRCLHRRGGRPLQIEERFVNAAAVPDFIGQDFTRTTASAYLIAVAPYSEAEHIVEASEADAETAGLLAIAEGAACLVLHRRTWFHDTPITRARLTHPGAGFRLGGRFAPRGPAPA